MRLVDLKAVRNLLKIKFLKKYFYNGAGISWFASFCGNSFGLFHYFKPVFRYLAENSIGADMGVVASKLEFWPLRLLHTHVSSAPCYSLAVKVRECGENLCYQIPFVSMRQAIARFFHMKCDHQLHEPQHKFIVPKPFRDAVPKLNKPNQRAHPLNHHICGFLPFVSKHFHPRSSFLRSVFEKHHPIQIT